jgi:hypothetical protein
MILTVELRSEILFKPDRVPRGQVVNVRIPRQGDYASFPLLRWLDPWGCTVYNRAQSEALIPELDRLLAETEDAKIREVRELAVRAVSDVHLYLVFIGD